VYLDHAASTPVLAAVAARVAEVAQVAANPASVHSAGVWATREVERARMVLAGALGAEDTEILFTSGASEANNAALKGVVFAARRTRPELLVSAVEHPSVLEPARWLDSMGLARLTVLPVDAAGRVRLEDVAAAIGPDTLLVSVQLANNETGVIHPVVAIGALCRARGVLLHCDASQGLCKTPVDVRACGIDLLTASGHKLHGPKGVGLLYVREGVAIEALLHGGGHERGLRGGTLNAPAIAGFGVAVGDYSAQEAERVAAMRDEFEAGLRALFPEVRIHGGGAARIGTISNFALPGRSGKLLFQALDRRGVLVSASSACHSTLLTPSAVLTAMGLTDEEANEAVRVSFGRSTTAADVDTILAALRDHEQEVNACR
jgi:cysteine desulfurase